MSDASAVLLRGINVGGHRKLAMADLRSMLADLGFDNVATYIQSGNAVVTGGPSEPAAAISSGLNERFGLADVVVVLRSIDQLVHARRAIESHFPEPTTAAARGAYSKLTHVVFLSALPAPQRRASLGPGDFGDDRFRLDIHDRVADLYVLYRVGAGSSKLTTDRIERAYGVNATARNVNTLDKIIALATPK
jgi:uncharacterized protein (DUF1697 family)